MPDEQPEISPVVVGALTEPPKTSESPLETWREKTASRLAYGLLGVFAITVFVPVLQWVAFHTTPSAELLDYVKHVASIVTPLLGVAFGFYFSQRRLGR